MLCDHPCPCVTVATRRKHRNTCNKRELTLKCPCPCPCPCPWVWVCPTHSAYHLSPPTNQPGKKDADGVFRVITLDPIVDFMKGLKFFSAFLNDTDMLYSLAAKFELHTFKKGAYVFNEGDIGNHFYIVLDGEVSIVKNREGHKPTTLVKLYRGHNFGETALESKGGKRTAGAIASQRPGAMASRSLVSVAPRSPTAMASRSPAAVSSWSTSATAWRSA